jgi:hypothetical protein
MGERKREWKDLQCTASHEISTFSGEEKWFMSLTTRVDKEFNMSTALADSSVLSLAILYFASVPVDVPF